MLKAARDGDDRKFAKYSSFIYGAPSDENVGYLANSVRQAVEKNLENGSEVKKTATYAILKVLDSVTATTNREDFNKNQFPIGKNIKGNVENAEEVVAIFEETLREIGVDDWQVVIDTKRGLSAVSANQETKTVVVPSDEKIKERSLSKKKLAGLVEHEIKTHALRRYNGERSKLQLLGLGLDRNLKGEEGIATYAEQQVTGTKDFAGIPRYLAIAVAKGLGGTQRDFRETFEVMNNYYLSTLKDGEDLESKAQNAAWTTCLRIFRGTTCQTQGAVFAKDLAYFAGNKDVWHLVSNDSEVVDTFSLGKFDPTNSEHVYLLKQLGILDSDLDELEQGE
jgi:adenosine/AMP kinase